MAPVLTAAAVALMALAVLGCADSKNRCDKCVTKSMGDTSGVPYRVQPTTTPAGQSDSTITISNPCGIHKVGVTVTVCDPDGTPDVTLYTLDLVHVHRNSYLHEAKVKGVVFCRIL